MSEIYIGKKFSSYDEFQRQLQNYSDKNSTVFWKRDARYLDSVKGRVKKAGFANPDLRYYTVRVCCVRGGRAFKKKKGATGQRLRTTKREDCPAFISLSISNDGQYLEISAMNLNHTHDNTVGENKRRRRRKPIQKNDMYDDQNDQNFLENNIELIYSNDNLSVEQCNEENLGISETVELVKMNNDVVEDRNVLIENQRYLEASQLTTELTKLITESSQSATFEKKLTQIEDLIRFWKSGLDVVISPVEKFSNSDTPTLPTVSQEVEVETEEYLLSSTNSTGELDQFCDIKSSDNVVYFVVDSHDDINSANVLEIGKTLKTNFQIPTNDPVELAQCDDVYDLENNDVPICYENSASSQSDVALEYYEVTINDSNEFTDFDSSAIVNSPNDLDSQKILLPTSMTTNTDPLIHRVSKQRTLDEDYESVKIS